jgi:hypothetical protein
MHRLPSTSPNRGKRYRLAGWALLCAAALCGEAGLAPLARAENAVTSPALERRVKAAFLYKFLGYAEFPAGAFSDAASPVTIGVVGSDDMAADSRAVPSISASSTNACVSTLRSTRPNATASNSVRAC